MPNTIDLCTVAEVKAWLGAFSTATDDVLLARIVTAASGFLVSLMNRQSITAVDYSEVRNGKGRDVLPLRNYPVVSVASVSIDGQAIPQATTSTASGWLNDDRAIYLRGYLFASGVRNVAVSYRAGWATVPADIQQAAIELAATKYRRRSHLDQNSQNLAGQTVSFSTKDLPPEVKTLIDQYKNRGTIE